MNEKNLYLTFNCVDKLDQSLYGKPVKIAIETYAGYALDALYNKDYKMVEHYLIQTKRASEGNLEE